MKKKFLRATELEDAIQAYDCNYYDTHDLAAIESEIDDYRREYKELREEFLVREGDYFSNYFWHDFNGPMKKF